MNRSGQKFDVERQVPRPPIYIVSDREAKLTGILGQVVKWYGLDTYGAELLTRRAAASMKATALLLVSNFILNLGAWWLLFNPIFGGSKGVFGLGWHSFPALLFSLLISTSILIYEQQFMTTDISSRRRRLILPIGLRIMVIIMAHLITTQPLELVFFKGPIERRIHDESIRLEAVTRLKDWKDSQKNEERVRKWIAMVRQSNPGGRVEADGWTFEDQHYNFFEQLRVLSDLRNGRPARWPEASQEDREALVNIFDFKSPVDELAETQLDAKFYSYAYWSVFGIAFVIPMLLLAFKLLQPQELRDYYSRERQDRALYELRARGELSERGFATAQHFLEKAGATVRHRGERGMEIVSGSLGRLTSFFRLPILLAVDSLEDEDVAELAQSLHPSSDDQRWMAGILFYNQPPDTLALARVQLSHRFITIPISLAAAERALSTNIDCRSQLAEFAEPYLPGADLFDDRNAISDTTTFFGRMKMLRRLEEDLLKHQAIGLFGLRKSGKTSVLLQLALILRHHPVVHIDLQLYGGKSRYGAELFNEIIQRLSTMLDVRAPESTPRFEPFARDAAAADVASEFAQRVSVLDVKLQESGYEPPIVCLLDEVERILPFPGDPREKVEEFNAFFGALRVLCQQQRRLSLLVTDVHPDCNRINQWTQAGAPTNPVFKFFKEVFLKPFSAEDTNTMLINIGRLMGCKQAFDARTLEQIFQASGGHPFVARQLASLLYQKVSFKDHEAIPWAAAQRYLDKSLTYSGTLKDYIAAGIWGDLEKRRFRSAMGVLQALACRKEVNEKAKTTLRAQIGDQFTENQLLDALQWLEAVGLIEWEETADFDHPRIHLPLLSQWLRMNLNIEETRQWQTA